MPANAPKQGKAQKRGLSVQVGSDKGLVEPPRREHPLLALQRTIGNQAVVRLLTPPTVDEALASPGTPLEPEIQRNMKQRFGREFSAVRVHADAKAAASAGAVKAVAYTVGRDIVFSQGSYRPKSPQGAKLLAHELAHVVQQERGGPSTPPLNSGSLEQAADAAGSAFVADRAPIHIEGSSAPGLARQPQVGAAPLSPRRPRSLSGALLKDEKHLDDAALKLEIELIEQWLNLHPASGESDYLRLELEALYFEELRRTQQRENTGQGPQAGTAAYLAGIVRKGRLEAAVGLWPQYRFLRKGRMEWKLGTQQPNGPFTWRVMAVRFTPYPSFASRKITFLQTVHQVYDTGGDFEKKKIDLLGEEYDPFYGMDWDPTKKEWIPESNDLPADFKSQPSSPADPAAYLFDQPQTRSPVTKLFETVAVVPETGEILGALRWSVGKSATPAECDDRPTSGFLVTQDAFYATPAELGKDREHEAFYQEILDGFRPDDATLTPEHKNLLDQLIERAKNRFPFFVVGGFGDAMDKDPMDASEQRAKAVADYLVSNGLKQQFVLTTGFGATWIRFHPGTKEALSGRNRRVQIRLRSAIKQSSTFR